MKVGVARIALALTIAGVASAAEAEPADLLLYGGRIVTVDKDFSVRSAMAVRDGRIVATGGPDLARRFQAKRKVDLKGQAVLPGFIDNHLHVFGKLHREVDLSEAGSIAEVKRSIAAKAQELGPGQWVLGNFWDETHFAERRLPTRQDLDEAAPRNPVVMIRDGGHSVAANTLGFKAVGIDRNSPDKTYVIEHGPDGEPSGIVREGFGLFLSKVPWDTMEQMQGTYVRSLKALLPLGITSAVAAGARIEMVEFPMFELPSWPEWQNIYRTMGADLPRMNVQIMYPGAEKLKAFPHHTGYGDDRLKLGGIGEMPGLDGGMTGPTACTKHDYLNQPGFRGKCMLTDAQLDEVLDTAAALGWQVGLHTIGDAAIEQAVNGYVRALQRHPQPDPRWFTSHFSFLPPPETLALMKKHGITAAQQPNFLYTLQQRYVANVDPQVRAHLIPVSTPMRAGINVSFGSDDLPIGPMLGLYAAVTRKGPNGERLGPSEAVSIRDAIRMYTLNTAYLTFDEKQKGSLEPGKLADFVVLDRDPLTIPSDQIKDIRVDMTAVGGRILYGREGTRWANLARTR